MFIKAHIRGGYRAAAKYLRDPGQNEVSRVVSTSDPDATTLDQAFQNMWQVASSTKTETPLFHFSINPFKDERLSDDQVKRIVEAYAAKCKMDISDHQHVIVEHVKDGRQHFHIMLNRVSQASGRAVDPGLYKKKAKECAREMEKELGLQILVQKTGWKHSGTRRTKLARLTGQKRRDAGKSIAVAGVRRSRSIILPAQAFRPGMLAARRGRRKSLENKPTFVGRPQLSPEQKAQALLHWAWENGRWDILAQFGIIVPSTQDP